LQCQVDNITLNKNDTICDGSPKTEVDADKGPEDKTTDEAPISPAERSLLQKIIRKGLVENKNDIEVQRRDPTSPLFSVKSFEALHL
jgi:ATP-dependent RNA helicase DDX19/DBP5